MPEVLLCENSSSLGRRWNLFFLIQEKRELFLIRGLFVLFLFALYRAAFCVFLASVCKAQVRLCVINIYFS